MFPYLRAFNLVTEAQASNRSASDANWFSLTLSKKHFAYSCYLAIKICYWYDYTVKWLSISQLLNWCYFFSNRGLAFCNPLILSSCSK